ncbi:hypothetical protein HPB47_013652 [Ixodes persulcatus]|uniref:Uncharacterized protein n=1 Tax=Ixodes persulcatus TaxID=34615 RepID=A0AC60QXZ4_IXOPE|nr:hypothetical protein HPB47_013652 [Ixodes persulcatus]
MLREENNMAEISANSFYRTRRGLGVAGNSVLALAQTVPTCSTVYLSRGFTSISLVDELVKKTIFTTGTVMKNRTPKGASLVSDKDRIKGPQGTADQTTRL